MMNSWPGNYYSNSDHLSIEANGDHFHTDVGPHSPTIDELLNSISDIDSLLSEENISGICDSQNLIESVEQCVESNDFGEFLLLPTASTSSVHNYENLLDTIYLPDYVTNQKQKLEKRNKKSIALSASVDVRTLFTIAEAPHQIEIVHDLEEKFRPRYKSDYFSQKGTTRKPRYVADREGNHFITLKVPVGIQGKIRVDWVTLPNESNERYYMPYQFQVSNDSSDIPDCNPIFVDTAPDSKGKMRLYLVLIKAKQDALKSLQPLQPFLPRNITFDVDDKNTTKKMPKLTPKQLIKVFQLAKSQLAFTFCTLSYNGNPIPQWDTLVYSTIIEEEMADNALEKTISCPRCSYSINISDRVAVDQDTQPNKRKNLVLKNEKLKSTKKQRSFD